MGNCGSRSYLTGSKLSLSSGKNISGGTAPNGFGTEAPGGVIGSSGTTRIDKGYCQIVTSSRFSYFISRGTSLVSSNTGGNGWGSSRTKTRLNRNGSVAVLALTYKKTEHWNSLASLRSHSYMKILRRSSGHKRGTNSRYGGAVGTTSGRSGDISVGKVGCHSPRSVTDTRRDIVGWNRHTGADSRVVACVNVMFGSCWDFLTCTHSRNH